ncbi:hypothetical protein QNI16_33025 [Cytophagaceae bacterium YF14B1]|uniref:Uncharacterized protein n=1 Tax=Xanthocytophaga flava TaxID=3048013 RepID=A0AAE3QUR5_9BACT|nr:hypothetical protein [Xanthocytophaga flavus]MDJ1485361.1 hypothetical protein [Xanthocytophaga flavus]
MSGHASFYLLNQEHLKAVEKAWKPVETRLWWGRKKTTFPFIQDFYTYTTFLEDYPYSGWIYTQVFLYFDDVFGYSDLELAKEANRISMGGATITLFTHRDKEKIIHKLAPSQLSIDKLRYFAEEYYETPEEKQSSGESLLLAIELLHNCLQKIEPGKILMLHVG